MNHETLTQDKTFLRSKKYVIAKISNNGGQKMLEKL